MPAIEGLVKLVDTFHRDIELARQFESPNPEDDLAVKASIVGFSYNAPTQEWDKSHYDFVRLRLDQDYRDEELANYGNNAVNIRLFFALSIGYLLGLYQASQINDTEFRQAELLIPGVIMGRLPKITANPI
jgi:hypothetical protein